MIAPLAIFPPCIGGTGSPPRVSRVDSKKCGVTMPRPSVADARDSGHVRQSMLLHNSKNLPNITQCFYHPAPFTRSTTRFRPYRGQKHNPAALLACSHFMETDLPEKSATAKSLHSELWLWLSLFRLTLSPTYGTDLKPLLDENFPGTEYPYIELFQAHRVSQTSRDIRRYSWTKRKKTSAAGFEPALPKELDFKSNVLTTPPC
ncbi:hypothetical protein ASPCAL07558 [Aspergillus calidoustus]|uniref:Uncharacterized protein n=1 Tax=Aspergillus calidoustus TaxID=454130 RepID=A0A0U5GMZ4_ASPCI|nr:hypothetical protein ASPCAL07558 [Aspergillus calidoustus]